MTTNSYFLEGEIRKGQFDWNADAFAEKQQQFANDLEDAIGYEFWPTKPRFAEYDYHIVNPNNNEFSATASIVPGIPILGIAELKYRTVASTTYPDTVVDSEKIIRMRERARHTDLPVLIFFRFIDEGQRLVEVEGGVAENESTSIALQQAIEEGVLQIIKTGITRGYWEYEETN